MRKIRDRRPAFMKQIKEWQGNDYYDRYHIYIDYFSARDLRLADVLAAGYKVQGLGPNLEIPSAKTPILGGVLHLAHDLDILCLDLVAEGFADPIQVTGKDKEFEWTDEQNYGSWTAIRQAMEDICGL